MTQQEYELRLKQFDVGVIYLLLRIHEVGGMHENEIRTALTVLAVATGFEIDLEEPESFVPIAEAAYMRMVERGEIEMPPTAQ
jgi:hypothetical protein